MRMRVRLHACECRQAGLGMQGVQARQAYMYVCISAACCSKWGRVLYRPSEGHACASNLLPCAADACMRRRACACAQGHVHMALIHHRQLKRDVCMDVRHRGGHARDDAAERTQVGAARSAAHATPAWQAPVGLCHTTPHDVEPGHDRMEANVLSPCLPQLRFMCIPSWRHCA